jgi:hypothetical protein
MTEISTEEFQLLEFQTLQKWQNDLCAGMEVYHSIYGKCRVQFRTEGSEWVVLYVTLFVVPLIKITELRPIPKDWSQST